MHTSQRRAGACVAALAVMSVALGCGRERPDAPTRATAAPTMIQLAGTTWSGVDSDGAAYTYTFRPGGELHYTSPTGTFDNGTWQQTDTKVTWEMNHHYTDYEGTFRGASLEGKARNKVGRTWTWTLTKQGAR